MTKRFCVLALALSAVIGMSSAQPGLAAPGGGGGGGMPSSSGPQYDPAKEFESGVRAYEAQDYKSAVTAFKRVLDVVPKHAPAQYLLGASYIGQEDYKRARRPLEMAVKYDDSLIEAHRDLAIAYARTGKPDKAAEERQLLADRLAQCAATCAEAAKLEAAVRAVEAVTAATDGDAPPQAFAPPGSPHAIDSAYVAAVSLINEERYEEAIARLDAAMWSAGPHPDLLTYLGFANRKLKRYEVARGWYEMALAVAPDHRGALEYYGELKLELGDVAGASAHLARLDALCAFGCQQADELRRWIAEATQSAS